MDRRNIVAGLMVMVSSMFLLAGTASANNHNPADCQIKTLPSFVDQGEFGEHSSIADIVEVQCSAEFAGTSVKLSSQQLYNRCQNSLAWIQYSPYRITWGASIGKVTLDDNGHAVVAVEGGPGCAEGESIISAHMEVSPGQTVMEDFTVYAPHPTAKGVFALPSAQSEDNTDSSVATIVEVEFPAKYAEQPVNISDEQLFTQCQLDPHLTWIGPDGGKSLFKQGVENVTVKLDNDGNAFVVLLGEESCFSGESVIEASLEKAPYTSYTTTFKVRPPGVH
jgi:hypothetical protein